MGILKSKGVRRIKLEWTPDFPWQKKLDQLIATAEVRFILAVMGRRAGKTEKLARLAGKAALAGKEVFWGAPVYDTSRIGFDRFRERLGPAITRYTQTPPHATMVGGGFCNWRSFDRPGAALGRGNDLVVVDEAARVKKQIIYEDVLPTVADKRGKVVGITTPRGKRHWSHQWYLKAMDGDPAYAVVHGPSTENPNPAVREFMELCRENMPEALFRQEFLAEFVEGEGSVFKNIDDCAKLDEYRHKPTMMIRSSDWFTGDDELHPGPRTEFNYIIGCDLAKHQDFTVMYAMAIETGEVHGMWRFNKIPWPDIKQRITDFAHRWHAPIMLDATGVGDPVFDDLVRAGVPTIPFKFTNQSKCDLIIALMNAMEKDEISYPNDETLIAELEAYEYQQLPSGKFTYNAPDGLHDDCVIALALANWGRAHAATGKIEWVA